MGTTQCYAMVRGSAIRVTGLGRKGSTHGPIRYATSKSVAKVTINEVTESGSDEFIEGEGEDNDPRLRLVRPEQTLTYKVDIDFLRCDPGVLALVAGVPLVYKAASSFEENPFGNEPAFGEIAFGEDLFGGGEVAAGFGESAFGEDPFSGLGWDTGPQEEPFVVGFDSNTRLPPASFALEVWSKLSGAACADGTRQYGYTVFPFLRGGYLTGFEFSDGLVSFNLRSARTRRGSRWGVGPYDLEGPYERLVTPVSGNTLYRQTLTPAPPPTEDAGVQETEDVIHGGTASVTSDDVIDGGTAASTSQWIVRGGEAV